MHPIDRSRSSYLLYSMKSPHSDLDFFGRTIKTAFSSALEPLSFSAAALCGLRLHFFEDGTLDLAIPQCFGLAAGAAVVLCRLLLELGKDTTASRFYCLRAGIVCHRRSAGRRRGSAAGAAAEIGRSRPATPPTRAAWARSRARAIFAASDRTLFTACTIFVASSTLLQLL